MSQQISTDCGENPKSMASNNVTAYSRQALAERAKLNRKKRKESIRNALRPHGYLQQIHKQLDRDFKAEAVETVLDQDGNEVTRVNNDTLRCALAEAKLKIDTWMKLLGKSLPDLKAVEVQHSTPEKDMSIDELTDAIGQLEKRLLAGGFIAPGSGGSAETEAGTGQAH